MDKSKLDELREKTHCGLNHNKFNSLEEMAENYFEGIWSCSELAGMKEHYFEKIEYFENLDVDCTKYRGELNAYYDGLKSPKTIKRK